MKVIVVEAHNDHILDLVVESLISRLRSYHRQNHSDTHLFAEAVKSIQIVDDDGELSRPKLSGAPYLSS